MYVTFAASAYLAWRGSCLSLVLVSSLCDAEASSIGVDDTHSQRGGASMALWWSRGTKR